jgi:hypothetical protein
VTALTAAVAEHMAIRALAGSKIETSEREMLDQLLRASNMARMERKLTLQTIKGTQPTETVATPLDALLAEVAGEAAEVKA